MLILTRCYPASSEREREYESDMERERPRGAVAYRVKVGSYSPSETDAMNM
jgi:hypothetical protein